MVYHGGPALRAHPRPPALGAGKARPSLLPPRLFVPWIDHENF